MNASDFPPGLIVIPAGVLSRYTSFLASYTSLRVPPGSRTVWGIGCDICANLNKAIREGLEPDDAWVWVMNDDHTFEPDVLLKLLARDVDLVGPLHVHRAPPHNPQVFLTRVRACTFTVPSWKGLSTLKGGLIKVGALAGAGMLIKRPVIDAIGDPWFEDWRGTPDDPRLEHNEDLWFCERAKEKGFQAFVDLDVQMGHTTPVTFMPMRDAEGNWDLAYECHGFR